MCVHSGSAVADARYLASSQEPDEELQSLLSYEEVCQNAIPDLKVTPAPNPPCPPFPHPFPPSPSPPPLPPLPFPPSPLPLPSPLPHQLLCQPF